MIFEPRPTADLVDEIGPDVVHVGHLNHLSTSLVAEAAARGVPVVYTLHDYWIMCPRGQFMQMHAEGEAETCELFAGTDRCQLRGEAAATAD